MKLIFEISKFGLLAAFLITIPDLVNRKHVTQYFTMQIYLVIAN